MQTCLCHRLSHDVTKFGRHSGNDHYLDSLELSYFISRWHAEVHFAVDDQCGKYVLRDNSLNGTYVNGSRVSKIRERLWINNNEQIISVK